jgi:hypothetical protein
MYVSRKPVESFIVSSLGMMIPEFQVDVKSDKIFKEDISTKVELNFS